MKDRPPNFSFGINAMLKCDAHSPNFIDANSSLRYYSYSEIAATASKLVLQYEITVHSQRAFSYLT